ncbi:hypothetical protein GTH44_35270 [Bradyrhizobium japonicum]|jgi:hypothetical protein|nr:hypothetical protein RN69_38070 [Bradyrhizobium japonicum]MYV87088.1 hypothetical protein [Bradyrhizobium japonicum]BAL13088.1 hypothetical protein BJ6T_78420 [Bradyrhizobium japonicum USDA 6]
MIRKIGKKDDTSVVFISKQGIGTDKTQIESRTERCVLYLTCSSEPKISSCSPERQSEAPFGRDCVFSPCKLNRPKHPAVRALGSCRQHSPGALGPSITAGMSKMEHPCVRMESIRTDDRR